MPRDRPPPEERPIRLGASEEVQPLRLVAPVGRPADAGATSATPAMPAMPATSAMPETSAMPAPRWDGPGLRAAREGAGLSLERLAERTRLPRATLEALEAQRVEKLPRAYLKGFLSTVAKELRLDGREVTRSYLDAIRPPPPPPGDVPEGEPAPPTKGGPIR